MGQDTTCEFSVSFQCTYTPENHELIHNVLNITDITVHLTCKNGELIDITESLLRESTEEKIIEFIKIFYGCEVDSITGKTLTCAKTILYGWARNLSRTPGHQSRENSLMSPNDLIKKIQAITNELQSAGVNEQDITIDYLMTDSY